MFWEVKTPPVVGLGCENDTGGQLDIGGCGPKHILNLYGGS